MKKVKEKNLESYFTESEDQLSLTRHKWFIRFLTDNLHKYNFKNSNILDVGCGNGNLLLAFQELGAKQLYGIDYSDLSQKKINHTIHYTKVDLNTQSPLHKVYKNKQFDIIACTETLEHLFDPENVLNYIIQQTKTGGYILITVPLDTNIATRIRMLFGQNIHDPFCVGSHIKFFKAKGFLDILKQKRNIHIIAKEFLGLGYGTYDARMPIFKFLAVSYPSLFASDMMILLRKMK